MSSLPKPAAAAEDDLEALFDQVSATFHPAEPKTSAVTTALSLVETASAAPANDAQAEPEDLEALFDQVAAESRAERAAVMNAAMGEPENAQTAAVDASAAGETPAAPLDPHDVFHRIGALTRNLHDALRELGYDKNVERAVQTLPDARARLAYIANLTGNAAERALGASEKGKSIQDAVQADAAALSNDWAAVYAGQQSVEQFKQTAERTRTFLASLAQKTDDTNTQFLEVMMAQDFHDLTGQVINRIATLATGLEEQLVSLLLETTPPDKRGEAESAWLSGPVIDAAGRSDVVTSQGQVDDLLESLGF